jgi:hypothetical protein
VCEDIGTGLVGGQIQTNAPGIARDHGGELKQLEAGSFKRLLHGQFHEFGDALQARVARQANDVIHIGTFAEVDDALAAKATVTPKYDAHLGPMLAQPLDQ